MRTPERLSPGYAWLLLVSAFFCIGAGVYANALHNPFHYDDHHGIVDNHYLKDAGNIPAFFDPRDGWRYFSPTEPKTRHYRPLLLTGYALNYAVGGESPVGFHLFNLLLHIASAVMLSALALRLGMTFRWATAVGLVFLVHPFHTEAVNYISARSSVQAGFFILSALFCFATARRTPGNVRWGWLTSAFALTGLALLTKEVAIAIPLLFLLHDLVYPPPRPRRWGLDGYGLHLLLCGLGAVYVASQGHTRHFLRMLAGEAGPRSVGDNLWLQAQVLVRYIRLTLLPTGLSIVHDFPGASGPNGLSAVCGALLAAVTAGALVLRRRAPLLLLGWGMFLIILAPTTIMPMNTPLQESRGYAAAAGLLLAMGGLLSVMLPPARTLRPWLVAAIIPLLLAGGTVARNPVWASDMTLWQDAVTKAPADHRAQSNLAVAYHAAGAAEPALTHYHKAIEIEPRDAAVLTNLASLLIQLGRYDEARIQLETALEVARTYPPTFYNYALLLELTGDPDGAREHYLKAIKLVPSYAEALMNLGILTARQGDLEQAAAYMEDSVRYAPAAAQGYRNLAVLYQQMGDQERARRMHRRADELARPPLASSPP